jgi:tetratricopeptide (TPR) repeat protein
MAAIYSFSARQSSLAGDFKTGHRNFMLAIEEWKLLVAAHPDNENYRRGLSLCLLTFSQFESKRFANNKSEAKKIWAAYYRNLRDDLRYPPWSLYDYAQIALERGNVLVNARLPDDGFECFEIGLVAVDALLEKSPNDPRYLLCHGQLLLRQARIQRRNERTGTYEKAAEAIASLERALDLDPRQAAIQVELAHAYRFSAVILRERREFDASEKLLLKALGLAETWMHSNLSAQFLAAGVARELAYVQLALDKKQDALTAFARCRHLWRIGRQGDALAPEEEKALAIACRDEGMLAQELNQLAIAREAFAEGIASFRLRTPELANRSDRKGLPPQLVNYAECHFYLGRLQAASGERDAAIENFRAAVALLEPFVNRPNVSPAFRDIYAKASSRLHETAGEQDSVEVKGAPTDRTPAANESVVR